MVQLPELEQLRERSRTAEHRVKVSSLYIVLISNYRYIKILIVCSYEYFASKFLFDLIDESLTSDDHADKVETECRLCKLMM